MVQLEAVIVVGREASTAGASKPIEYFVDDTEIARMLGIHHRTVQQMARDGVIPAYPLGEGKRKTWRFLRSEVHEWMQAELSKTRYQQGSVRRVTRKQGPDVWIFRWRNTRADGSRKENNRVIGTVLEYRTKAAAERVAEALRININSTNSTNVSSGDDLRRARPALHRKRTRSGSAASSISEGPFHSRGESPQS